MTPTASELLLSCFGALTRPGALDGTSFAKGEAAAMAMINVLASQEARAGVEVRVWENQTLRRLFERHAGSAGLLEAEMTAAAAQRDEDLSVEALDKANAALRRLLISFHLAAEDAGDQEACDRVLDLLCEMAKRRRLSIPPIPSG